MIEVLRALDCDVVALNEVPSRGQQLARVAEALEMRHAFGEASWLGNALLSKRPLGAIETIAISGAYGEARSALVATVDGPAGPLDVCCTHLDPSEESLRLQQLDKLGLAMEQRAAAHLVMGDFNALRLADYSPAVLDSVRAMRARNGREEPLGEVVARMDAWGYLDGFRAARGGGLAEPLPEGEIATCWAGTRIDYVWLSPALAEGCRVRRCWRVESDASDHLPVVLEIERREPSTPRAFTSV